MEDDVKQKAKKVIKKGAKKIFWIFLENTCILFLMWYNHFATCTYVRTSLP